MTNLRQPCYTRGAAGVAAADCPNQGRELGKPLTLTCP